VIVYESVFGNTRIIAEAIAEGIEATYPDAQVALFRVTDADPEVAAAADLLILGGPTHMRRMSSHMTRTKGVEGELQKAEKTGTGIHVEPDVEGPGVRDFLERLPKVRKGARAAAFDTRAKFRLAGGAARPIAKRLHRHGYELVAEPMGFVIEGTEGPLAAGETERARTLGAHLYAECREHAQFA
jgi:hypothetical protein